MKTPVDLTTSKTCTKCVVSKPLSSYYTTGCKVDGSPKYNSWCKSCISEKQSEYHRRTYGDDGIKRHIAVRTKSVRSYLTYLRAKAVGRKHQCLTVDELEALWQRQHGCCALTGWPMTMSLGNGVVPTNISIDRIDSNIGYVDGNVQLVCRCVNVAKSNLSEQDFFAMCLAILETKNG